MGIAALRRGNGDLDGCRRHDGRQGPLAGPQRGRAPTKNLSRRHSREAVHRREVAARGAEDEHVPQRIVVAELRCEMHHDARAVEQPARREQNHVPRGQRVQQWSNGGHAGPAKHEIGNNRQALEAPTGEQFQGRARNRARPDNSQQTQPCVPGIAKMTTGV